jgi:broad specificity phosphatase PhoE
LRGFTPADTEAAMSKQTILLIRHGESTFNATYANDGVDPMLFDAPLTARGKEQVAAARLALRDRPVDIVLASPLTRAVQTALGIFADHPSQPAIVIEAGHRERLESSCDRGRPPHELKSEFPGVSFDHLPETWWHDEGVADERGISVEPLDVMLARLHDFALALRDRKEGVIAVVGHATFFHHLTGRWMSNCEIVDWDGVVAAAAP